jgi:hypothetical protein
MTASEIDALIGEAAKGMADLDTRTARADALSAMLQAGSAPGSEFPEPWRSAPNVMFEPGDPEPEPFAWGERRWATERAYDEELAAFLGDLACGREVAQAQTRGLARRALEPARPPEGAAERLWPRLFAARVTVADCPPAEALPGDMRRRLDELAAQGNGAVASPQAAPPARVE